MEPGLTSQRCQTGMNVDYSWMSSVEFLLYADDQVILEPSACGLQEMDPRLHRRCAAKQVLKLTYSSEMLKTNTLNSATTARITMLKSNRSDLNLICVEPGSISKRLQHSNNRYAYLH
ncbi:hypothetical protein EVAR_6618_1 [Eumeta japonica]|uniref:Reverse transcriptase domain-containing protein n=1 Tax=Eumeta variegata TaxID=151549 RepID=A0A4C1TN50_EUMVA|nr:hypothetical protein EVAR_6618_1 [Eumeta japonica]